MRLDLARDWISATSAQLEGATLSSKQTRAVQQVLDKSFNCPDDALKVFYSILKEKPESSVVECLAIGPVTDLLMIHGQPYIRRIIAAVTEIATLRDCLEHVNIDQEDCPSISELYSFLDNKETSERDSK